ncbi:MAG: hypothetical protein K9J06_06340 [Flavobacteriales bacterium]|nr:hypothetical protein [Flavobacteriales bacterium]
MTIRLLALVFAGTLLAGCEDSSPLTEEVAEFIRVYESGGHQFGHQLILDDQGLLIIGTSMVGNQSCVLLMRTDLNGEPIWSRQIATELYAEGEGLARTADGGLILVGSHPIAPMVKNLLLVRTDSEGHVLWQRSYGGAMNDIGRGVIQLHDGSFMVIGTTSSLGPGVACMYVLKVDAQGNELWSKAFGGISLDGGSDLTQLDAYQVVLLGFTESLGAGGRDQWLVGMSLDGDSLWSRTVGGTGYEESQGFASLPDGGFLLCGHSSSIDPVHDLHALRLDGSGSLLWEHHLGTMGNHDGGEGVATDADGNFWFVGRGDVQGLWEEVFVIRTDAEGQILSEEYFGGSGNQMATDVKTNANSVFILAHSQTGGGGTGNVMLVKRAVR